MKPLLVCVILLCGCPKSTPVEKPLVPTEASELFAAVQMWQNSDAGTSFRDATVERAINVGAGFDVVLSAPDARPNDAAMILRLRKEGNTWIVVEENIGTADHFWPAN